MRYLFFFICVALAGCSGLQHLDEVLRLKAYSDEKDAQSSYVQAHDARFEELLRRAGRPGSLDPYVSKADIVRDFGEPVLCRPEGDLEKCLYRRIVKPLQSPKVYFYFNARGALARWEKVAS